MPVSSRISKGEHPKAKVILVDEDEDEDQDVDLDKSKGKVCGTPSSTSE